ncbi:MAG: threonine aldolase family protein [Candidatus Ventricola sp.]
MIFMNCDYNEGAHEQVLARIVQTNVEQTAGYCLDPYCAEAAALIRRLCQAPDAAVHFLVGGTQTNAVVIGAALRPYQGVIAAQSGHISVHESGAIEADGHKVIELPAQDGKLSAAQVDAYCRAYREDESAEYIVQPRMVYISHPTELGTLYSLSELAALSAVCREHGLYLYADGARLGYAMAAEGNDVFLPEMARLCDAFYIGAAKNGALFGEAVVLCHPALAEGFRSLVRRKGALLAKGRLLGVQFLALLEDGLYQRIARHADEMAARIRTVLHELQLPIVAEGTTNLIFTILPDACYDRLKQEYKVAYQHRTDESHCLVRLCTSWATQEEAVDRLCALLREAMA